MKKIYMTPELEEIKIQTMQMIATSSMVLDDDPGKLVDDVDDLLAPGFDFEDDDFDLGAEESFSDFE